MSPETKGRVLATKLLSKADRLALARSKGDRREAELAQRELDALKAKLTPSERKLVLAFFDKTLPADSASEILLGAIR